MSAHCIRIELEYADGARQVATGEAAEKIRQWLNTCQAWAAENPEIVYDGPQPEYIPGVGLASQPTSETEVRGDQESA